MKAEYDIITLKILAGKLPKRAHAMVLEWSSQHRVELMNNWQKAIVPASMDRIKPLD